MVGSWNCTGFPLWVSKFWIHHFNSLLILKIMSFSLGMIELESGPLFCLFPNNDNGGGLGKLQERLQQEALGHVLQNEFWVVLKEVNFEFLWEFVALSLVVKKLSSVLYLWRSPRTWLVEGRISSLWFKNLLVEICSLPMNLFPPLPVQSLPSTENRRCK